MLIEKRDLDQVMTKNELAKMRMNQSVVFPNDEEIADQIFVRRTVEKLKKDSFLRSVNVSKIPERTRELYGGRSRKLYRWVKKHYEPQGRTPSKGSRASSGAGANIGSISRSESAGRGQQRVRGEKEHVSILDKEEYRKIVEEKKDAQAERKIRDDILEGIVSAVKYTT